MPHMIKLRVPPVPRMSLHLTPSLLGTGDTRDLLATDEHPVAG